MSSKHAFAQVNAFTNTPYSGNPCAVVFDADDLSAAQMQIIAREFNLSETAFVLRSRRADLRARYFTPGEEIPLAGHPTIATLFASVETGRLEARGERFSVQLELAAGIISVEVSMRETTEERKSAVEQVTMSQITPVFGEILPRDEVLPAFNLNAEAVLDTPIQVVSTGTPQLMIPVRSITQVEAAVLNRERYRSLRGGYNLESRFFSAHVFCQEGFTKHGDTYARHFGVPPDMVEDPFTGSATGGMACYLWRYGLIDQPRFTAEQGHGMGRPGLANVEVIGERNRIEMVRVGGRAVQVMSGEIQAPPKN